MCVESKFSFNRCLRQASVEAPRLWQKMVMQLLANVEEVWVRRGMGILLDLEGQKKHQICIFMWVDNFSDHVSFQEQLGADAEGSDSGT